MPDIGLRILVRFPSRVRVRFCVACVCVCVAVAEELKLGAIGLAIPIFVGRVVAGVVGHCECGMQV